MFGALQDICACTATLRAAGESCGCVELTYCDGNAVVVQDKGGVDACHFVLLGHFQGMKCETKEDGLTVDIRVVSALDRST